MTYIYIHKARHTINNDNNNNNNNYYKINCMKQFFFVLLNAEIK